MKWFLCSLSLLVLLGCGPHPDDRKARDAQIRESGYKAGLAAQPVNANPHTPPSSAYGGHEHRMWAEGWLDGDSDRRLKEKEKDCQK